MKIFTAQQMRELDRLTVERCGIPYATLMETAGARVVEAMEQEFGSVAGKSCVIFCGKGNNGGDGAVIARLLSMRGAARVSVLLFGRLADTTGEARANFEAVRSLSETVPPPAMVAEAPSGDQSAQSEASATMAGGGTVSFAEIDGETEDTEPAVDLVVDALFGTGMTRPVAGPFAAAVECINRFRANVPVVSVDIPSGLSSDCEHPIGPHVHADLTVSFTGPKIGNVLAPACAANGKLVIASIGTPAWLFDEVGSQLNLVEEAQIKDWLSTSRRPAVAHKGSVGDVLLIAGSRGKTGAAALASEAVLRAGAGLITVATAHSAQALLVTQCRTEVMTEPLAETERGAVSHAALERALELADKRAVLAVGSGLSSSDESTRRFVREFVERRTAPLVIDADGLNALAPWPAELRGSDELPLIITPHPGEMARLTGKTNAEIVADRINIARAFAVEHHVVTVLKGSRSLIAAPAGEVYVNPTGNAGMATAGSGDVLTGTLAGLLAQCPQDPLGATVAAVYLHGLAGDIAAEQLGLRALIASDITAHLSAAILRIGGEAERGHVNSITTI